MELTKAFQMSIEYLGKADKIRVDGGGRVCLTDLVKFFPRKTVKEWLTNKATKEFILTVERFLNGGDSTPLDISDFGNRGAFPKGLESIYAKRGKYDGGTYAHELIALEFATWLSPEFKLNVFLAYQNGSQRKENWNIKRILAAHNYKIQSLAVKDAHDPAKHYHYSNEALMINEIVFGERRGDLRDTATIGQLDRIAALEGHNATMIKLCMPYSERKAALSEFDLEYSTNLIGA